MTDVQGTCDPRFESVKQTFAGNFDQGLDVGASVAVTLDGEVGRRPLGRPRRRGADEAVGARHHHQRLVDHQDDDGAVRADARRPRRARPPRAGGDVLARVRRRTARTASRCATSWRTPRACRAGRSRSTGEDLYDWEKCTSLLAAQAPWWEPGTASGYHAITQGYLVGEVVRRVTGRVGRHVLRARRSPGPLGADFHIGTPARVRRPRRRR